ncbi:MAG TPA: amidohydrolase [Pyrinomonadaceae bacterium]|jgi:predicted amidohydrolase YtcJ|nr:amidohydrolase [Pyrinomonadaceae bacterium]
MKAITTLFVALGSAFLLSPAAAKVQPADLVFKNGNIYTVNQQQPMAEAVAVKGDRIIFVGSNRVAQNYVGKNTRVIDLGGKTMVPGMTDAHHHLSGVGFRELTLNLEGITNLEAFLAKVKERVDQKQPGEWVTGRGWIETFWTPPVFPTRWDLDKIAPNNPVFLNRADGHGAVANSAAIKIAGVDKNTPSPFGGEVSKDKQSGEPNGMFLDAAQDLIQRHIPGTTLAEAEQAIILGVKRDVELGWTQVQDPGGSYDDVAIDSKLFSEGKIKLRIYKALSAPGKEALQLFHDGPIIGKYANHLTVRSLKLYADGSLGSRSAALLAPYSDKPETSGFLTIKEEDLQPLLKEALRKGIQIETHAIGDRGNRFILDQYEKAMNAVPKAEWKIKEPRWRVEHSQIVNPADISRFKKLGIIPSMQPSHAIGDLHFAPSRLGVERLAGAYAWQSFIKSGSIIPGGSDAPVERGEPMIEFYAAVARKDMKGFSGEGWHPEEAATREQALKMFTIWPAYAAFEETQRGSIEIAKLADFTIFSADIMKIPEMEILKTRCLMTVIGGEIVYEAKE